MSGAGFRWISGFVSFDDVKKAFKVHFREFFDRGFVFVGGYGCFDSFFSQFFEELGDAFVGAGFSVVSWIEVGEDGAAFLDFFFGDGIAGSGDGFAEVDEVLTLAASGKSDDFCDVVVDAASKAEFDFVSGEVVGKAHGFEGVVGGGGDVGDGIEDGSIHIKNDGFDHSCSFLFAFSFILLYLSHSFISIFLRRCGFLKKCCLFFCYNGNNYFLKGE